MNALPSVLSRILQNLPLPGLILKGGELLEANDILLGLGEPSKLVAALNQSEASESPLIYRMGDSNYMIRRVSLDDHGVLVLLIQSTSLDLIYDDLTGALDRNCFEAVTSQLIQNAAMEGKILGFLFMDLDGFKHVNDSWGHETGDLVLKKTSERIRYTIRSGDYCFRYGGDEFVVLLVDLKDRIHSCLSARRLLAAISEPIPTGTGEEITIGASIGISSYPADGQLVEVLMGKADEAMYQAKRTGKNSYQLCG